MQKQIQRRLKRLQKRLDTYDLDSPAEKYNYFGGWSVGYIQGQIAVLEDLLDTIEEDFNTFPSPAPYRPEAVPTPYIEPIKNEVSEMGPPIDITNRKPSTGIVDESF